MEKRKKEERQQHPALAESPVGDLLPEILSEILSRVPYRSLCRFKCVSKAWLALCSDPAVRRTLSGFFCYSQLDVGGDQRCKGLSFLNLSGWGRPPINDPSLRHVDPVHCCGGILICYCSKADISEGESDDAAAYVVCNPATEEIWLVLAVPPNAQHPRLHTAWLCFDPAAPRHFKVFVFVQSFSGIQKVQVYSSETGKCITMSSEWSHENLFLDEDSALQENHSRPSKTR